MSSGTEPDHDPAPAVTVVVATYQRPALLAGLLDALADQDLPDRAGGDGPPFEVVVVDNASEPPVPPLGSSVGPAPLRLVRLGVNRGPGPARNRGVALARGPVVAFTDDDCLPEPGWLAALVSPLEDPDVVVVQGRTVPPREPAPGPWARGVWVDGPSPWFETCNIAYRRSAIEAVGGFDEGDPLTARAGGQAFGEDAVLGDRVLARGGRRHFAPDAVVRHRWQDATWGEQVREQLRLAAFPGLARRSPTVAAARWRGLFLSRERAEIDLGLIGVVGTAATRRPWLLLAALPWLRRRAVEARSRAGRRRLVPLRLVQLLVRDTAGAGALVVGSVRERRAVL